jgi:hypothetical protein
MPSWFSSLRAIVDPFIQICLLRRGPQDLPTSGILLAIALAAHTLMSTLFVAVYESVVKALLSSTLDTVLLATLTATVLFVRGRNARLIQTLTALAGTGAIISLISLPISAWFLGAGPETRESVLALVLLATPVVWGLAVAGHIFRNALSIPFFAGLVLAFAFMMISLAVFRVLFHPSA